MGSSQYCKVISLQLIKIKEKKKKKKTKNRVTVRPCSPTAGHVSGEKHDLKGYMHPSVNSSTVNSSQDMDAT